MRTLGLLPADGVLFQGNLRGDPAAAYQKLTTRLKVRPAALHCLRMPLRVIGLSETCTHACCTTRGCTSCLAAQFHHSKFAVDCGLPWMAAGGARRPIQALPAGKPRRAAGGWCFDVCLAGLDVSLADWQPGGC